MSSEPHAIYFKGQVDSEPDEDISKPQDFELEAHPEDFNCETGEWGKENFEIFIDNFPRGSDIFDKEHLYAMAILDKTKARQLRDCIDAFLDQE